jgi:hypothetical protein
VWIALVSILGIAAVGSREGSAMADTFGLHPGNSRCFVYEGKPLVLITATEHYGAVLNGEFDYVAYLDELARNGLNLSRTFTFYRESEGWSGGLAYSNTLAPRPGHEVLPFKRTGPGEANDGGLKFDLTEWDSAYLERFRDFLREAERRDIIVEVVLFCNTYDVRRWERLPCHPDNNVNGVGGGITEHLQYMEGLDPTVMEFQKAFTRRIVQELNEFDNIYYEICNETSSRGRGEDVSARIVDWHLTLCGVIRETEEALPKKHLIAVNAHDTLAAYTEDGREYIEAGDAEYFGDARVDIVNYHYISRREPGRGTAVYYPGMPKEGHVGNIRAFMRARGDAGKPMVFDENWSGVVRKSPTNWDRNRMEAWEMILAGGAGFDHLDWSFTPADATGSGKTPINDGRRLDGRALRKQFGALAALWRECGPAEMAPDDELVVSVPEHCLGFASSLSDGRLHVVYVADGRGYEDGFGEAVEGDLVLRLAEGDYRVRMLNPVTGEWGEGDAIKTGGEETRIELPEFRQDWVVVLRRR